MCMLFGIDPVTIISIVSGVIIAGIGFYKGNQTATVALESLQSVMDVADAFYKGNADKVWTDTEDATLGKAVRTALLKIHNGALPVFLNSIKK